MYFLSFTLVIIFFDGFTEAIMFKIDLYISLHWLKFAMNAVDVELFSTLNELFDRAIWICFQILLFENTSIIFIATLSSTLTSLRKFDVAMTTATYSFVRSFDLVWGVTITSIVFNDLMNRNLASIDDSTIRAIMQNGAAYFYVSEKFISSLSSNIEKEVINLYVQTLRIVWLIMTEMSCLAFDCVFIKKQVELRKNHTTEFELAENKDKTRDAKMRVKFTTTTETEIQREV